MSKDDHLHVDSSYSKVYLTSSNNPFQPIHYTTDNPEILAERRQRNDLLAQRKILPRKSVFPSLTKSIPHCLAHNIHSIKDNPRAAGQGSLSSGDMAIELSEEQINALPLSSDEEDIRGDKGKADTTNHKTTGVKRPAPQDKKSDSRRSKRHKKDEEPSTVNKEVEEKSKLELFRDDLPDFLSQHSQGRKGRGYAGLSQRSFKAPSLEPNTPPGSVKNKGIQIHKSSPITKSTVKAANFSPPPASMEETKTPSLVIHRDDTNEEELEPSLNSTTFSRDRRGSTSSLSSIDSLPDYQLDAAAKKRLMGDELDSNQAKALPPGHFLCAICRRPSNLAGLDFPFLPKEKPAKRSKISINLAKLPISQQQALCRAHRVRDAQNSWVRNDYPTITSDSWSTFPDRISKHISHLSSILRRKKSSYYLKHLDDALTGARGYQKDINIFFNVTTLTLIRHGYYGPKGAKLTAQTLLNDTALQKILDKQMKSDKNMRTTGVGRLVDNVLVPEVLMRLVGEDMGVQDEEARKILDESSELGVLLWGDDDEVEAQEDDDI